MDDGDFSSLLSDLAAGDDGHDDFFSTHVDDVLEGEELFTGSWDLPETLSSGSSIAAAAQVAPKRSRTTSQAKARRAPQPKLPPAPAPQAASSSSSVLMSSATGPSTLDFSVISSPGAGGAAVLDAAVAATQTLRRNSMHLLKGLTAQSLESFRNAFFGGCESDDDDDDDDDEGDGTGKRKRKRTKRPNPDADLISFATEEQMRLSNIDPNSKDGKKQRRKIRNRMSALLHRERKKMYIEALESMVREKDLRIKQLEAMQGASGGAGAGAGAGSSNSSSRSFNMTDEESVSVSSASVSLSRTGSPSPDEAISPGTISTSTAAPAGGSGIMLVTRGGGGSLRAVLPVLSVLCLLCVAMFDGRSSLPMAPVTVSVSPVLDSVAPLALPAVSVPVSVPALPVHVTTHGRRLLDVASLDHVERLPAPVDWSETENNSSGSAWNSPLLDMQHHSSLWRYRQRIATLFPRLASSQVGAMGNASSHSPSSASKEKNSSKPPAARHLRSRGGQSTSSSSDASSTSTSAGALVVRSPMAALSAPVVPHHAGPETPLSPAAAANSRVLMTHGKALLDPSLVVSPKSSESSTVTTSALSTWRAPEESSGKPTVPVVVPTSADAQVLVMLLPASQVRWGRVWADSEAGTTESLLHMLNETHSRSPGTDEDKEPMWVEIGCSVFRAQLVANVTLVS